MATVYVGNLVTEVNGREVQVRLLRFDPRNNCVAQIIQAAVPESGRHYHNGQWAIFGPGNWSNVLIALRREGHHITIKSGLPRKVARR